MVGALCGLSIVLALYIICSLIGQTITSFADGTDKVQVRALDGIPADLSIAYGTGATHAERGRTTYRISADGKVLYEKTRGSRSTGTRVQEQYRLTVEDVMDCSHHPLGTLKISLPGERLLWHR